MVPSGLKKVTETSEKVFNAGTGGTSNVQVGFQLAEPIIYLRGFDASASTLLRGTLHIHISKPTKLKAISLRFKGRARTEWPEGIPPRKLDNSEEKVLVSHTWPFFSADFPESTNALLGLTQDVEYVTRESTEGFRVQGPRVPPPTAGAPTLPSNSSPRKNSLIATAAEHRVGPKSNLPPKLGASKSYDTASRGYKVYFPGTYKYFFEHPIAANLPESVNIALGSVKYELEAVIERAGAFKSKVSSTMEVVVVRAPSEASTESFEPIGISRTWEDQLHYEIIISGKSFPIGSRIPIAFKLTPLAKVRCHRIKVFITENCEYWCRNKKIHRIEPTRQVQLIEKVPDESTGSLLGELEGVEHPSATEFEFAVQIPSCGQKDRNRLHFDTTYEDLKVHHWIKISMRVSKTDPDDSSKRRHFEISIDSPIHLVSCRATETNTNLPAYTVPSQQFVTSYPCPCVVNQSRVADRSAGSQEVFTGMGRPMHLLRQPSTNPPGFFEDVAPPLITPPPLYENVAHREDYFQRTRGSSMDEVRA